MSEELKKLQSVEVEILDEIARLCEKHSIRYCLIGGTLLGAVRHKGFIPWDDDLDIVMPRADYDKFCAVSKIELDSKYYLHNIQTDKKYWLPFAKIRKHGTIFDEKNCANINAPKGIYVDIFPLDFSKGENSKEQAFRTFWIKQIAGAIIWKRGIHETKHKLLAWIRNIFFLPFTIKFLTKIELSLMQKLKKGDYYVNFGSNYKTKKQTMPISYYEPYDFLEFEEKKYPVPKEYEKVLTRIYGSDYMQLPPEEKRVTHKPVRLIFDINDKEKGKNNG